MYHRVGKGKHANSVELMRSHLQYLKENFPIVLPGETLPKRRLSICLTFNDASYDFYHHVFPLLKEFNLRALLGVPVKYILDETSCEREERLSVPYTLAMQDGFWEKKAPFCTWNELKEMVFSGHVHVASHSYMHCNLTFNFVDLEREIVKSKKILEQKLSQSISSFIYPFGKTNMALHEFVKEHYPFTFRIGSGINRGWHETKKPISRIIGDNMESPDSLTSLANLARYYAKSLFL